MNTLPLALTRLRSWLGLERNIVIMLLTFLLVGLGEELWVRFVPKYLELLGASAWAVAWYGTLRDLLDALYAYPGGWLTDRLGQRTALVLFALLAIAGYGVYLLAPSWPWVLAGTVLVMAWSSLTLPAIFAIVGDSLPPARRATGFGVQAILKRVPILVAPPLGGWMIATWVCPGSPGGPCRHHRADPRRDRSPAVLLCRAGAAGTRAAAHRRPLAGNGPRFEAAAAGRLPGPLGRGHPQGLPYFVRDRRPGRDGGSVRRLTSIQMIAATLVYIPLAKMADRMNRKPFVLLTFGFFALFPLVLVTPRRPAPVWLAGAFVIAGLRETGEPARKALILDLASASVRGRAVGLYYLLRGLAVFPASLMGGWLWTVDRRLPFYVAFTVGVAGCLVHAHWGPADAPRTPSSERSLS